MPLSPQKRAWANGRSMLTVRTATFAGSRAASSSKRFVCASQTGVSSDGHHAQDERLAREVAQADVAEAVRPALVELEVRGAVADPELRARDGQGVAAHLHGSSGHERLLLGGCRGSSGPARDAAPRPGPMSSYHRAGRAAQAGSPRRGPER